MTAASVTWNLLVNGDTVPLGERPMVLGRSAVCDVVLNHELISRRHAEIRWGDGGIWIRDLDSQNGVFVNDHRIDGETRIFDGDRVLIGPVQLSLFAGLLESSPPISSAPVQVDDLDEPTVADPDQPPAAPDGPELHPTLRDLARTIANVVDRMLERGDEEGALRLMHAEVEAATRKARFGKLSNIELRALGNVCLDLQSSQRSGWLDPVLRLYEASGAVMDHDTVDRFTELLAADTCEAALLDAYIAVVERETSEAAKDAAIHAASRLRQQQHRAR